MADFPVFDSWRAWKPEDLGEKVQKYSVELDSSVDPRILDEVVDLDHHLTVKIPAELIRKYLIVMSNALQIFPDNDEVQRTLGMNQTFMSNAQLCHVLFELIKQSDSDDWYTRFMWHVSEVEPDRSQQESAFYHKAWGRNLLEDSVALLEVQSFSELLSLVKEHGFEYMDQLFLAARNFELRPKLEYVGFEDLPKRAWNHHSNLFSLVKGAVTQRMPKALDGRVVKRSKLGDVTAYSGFELGYML